MKTLAFYNLKGGVGKTTSAVNIAYFAAQEGNRTLLWDLDPQRSATFYLRIKPAVKAKAKYLIKDRSLIDRLIKTTEYANLDLFPAYFKMRHLELALGEVKKRKRRLAKLIQTLSLRYDYLFLDCPVSLSLLSENVFRASDYLIIPVIPTVLSLQTFKQVRKYVLKHFRDQLQLIPFFSMVDGRKSLHRKIMDTLGPKANFCKTRIPTRSVTEQMGLHRAPLPAFSPDSQAAKEYKALWEEIKTRLQ